MTPRPSEQAAPGQPGSAPSNSLIRIGFPERRPPGGAPVLCFGPASGGQMQLAEARYACPQCSAAHSEIPTVCPICSLRLMSSVDLTKTYHHLFPLPVFAEVRMRRATRSNPNLPLSIARTRLLNRNPNPKPTPNTSPPHTPLPTRARTVTAGRAPPAAPRRARSRPPARDRRRARGPPGGAPLLRLRRGAAPRRGLRVPALPPRVLQRVRRVPTRDAAHVPGVPDAQTAAEGGGERFRLEP